MSFGSYLGDPTSGLIHPNKSPPGFPPGPQQSDAIPIGNLLTRENISNIGLKNREIIEHIPPDPNTIPNDTSLSSALSALSALSSIQSHQIISMGSPALQGIYQRLAEFQAASPIVQNILILFYDSLDNYLQAMPHPLEPYIFAFDQAMGSDSTVRALGVGVGILVPLTRDYEADEIFIDKLVEHILFLKETPEYSGDIVQYSSNIHQLPTTAEIITIGRTQFDNLLKHYQITCSEDLYQDRLAVLRQLYQFT